jgi:hypothetical protein
MNTRVEAPAARGLPPPDRELAPAQAPPQEGAAARPAAALEVGEGLRRRIASPGALSPSRGPIPTMEGAAEPTPPTQVEAALGPMPWHPSVGPNPSQAQRELEGEYLQWANAVLAQREQQYDETYRIDTPMAADWRAALLPAAIEGFKGIFSAAPRGAARNAVAAKFDPARGELSFAYDAVTAAGAVGGSVAYLSDAVIVNAIDRRAEAGNVAKVTPIDVDALVPIPCKARLVIENGAKRYERIGHEANAANVEAAEKKRDALRRWQSGLASKGVVSAFVPPLLSGVIGVARRGLTPEAGLTDPGTLLWTSAISSALASMIHKPAWTMLQVAPKVSQTDVSDLMGGTQKLPLYKVHLPRPDEPAPGLSDAPSALVKVANEAATLMLHSVDVRRGAADLYQQYKDTARFVHAGTWASIGSTAIGILLAQVMRQNSLTPLTNEGAHSDANLLQQFGQSGAQSFLWGAFKDSLDSVKYPLSKSMDAHYDKRMGRLTDTAELAVDHVKGLTSAAKNADNGDYEALRFRLIEQQLGSGEPTLESAQRALTTIEDVLELSNPAVPPPIRATDIRAALETAVGVLQKRHELASWRGADPARSATSPSLDV